MIKSAFVFPGQGSQEVGMGRDLYDNFKTAQLVFEEAADAISFDMKKLCFDGPDTELGQTQNTQPALLTVSVAAYRVLTEESDITACCMAGHSLGEYSALVASGAISFADAVKLVRYRGQVMTEVAGDGSGKMAAILGLARDDLNAVLDEVRGSEVLVAANYNCPGQIVISGDSAAVDRAMEACKAKGAKRALPLSVSGPFHSDLMAKAADKLQQRLGDLKFADPKCAVYSNVTANAYSGAAEIPGVLVEQIKSSVKWEDAVGNMLESGTDLFVEIGPKKILSGLLKRISRSTVGLNVADTDSLKKTVIAFNKIKSD